MIYLIQGTEEYFIKSKLNEIKNSSNSEVVEFNGSDKSFSIDEMLEACANNSLFTDKNVVLVKDPYFLCKKVDDKELEKLSLYINNPLYETDLVFYTYENNFKSVLKSYKLISSNAQIINCNSYDYKTFPSFMTSKINEYGLKLNRDCINYLNSICKYSATLLVSNLEILKLYPSEITVDVVKKLCTAKDNSESFDLINAIVNKDITKSISLVREMLKDESSILGIIALIAGQLRFLYQVSYYKDLNYNSYQIAQNTNSKEARIRYSLDTLRKLSSNDILELLAKLSVLDIKCKSDYTISDISKLELFILELTK